MQRFILALTLLASLTLACAQASPPTKPTTASVTESSPLPSGAPYGDDKGQGAALSLPKREGEPRRADCGGKDG